MATGVVQRVPPFVDRFTRTTGTCPVAVSGIDEMIHTPCLASKATDGSLTRGKDPGGFVYRVIPGKNPRVQLAPPLRDVAHPMSDEPPLKNRPVWKVATIVDPKANVSGSTSVLCMLVVLVNGSELIRRRVAPVATPAAEATTARPAAVASATLTLFIAQFPPLSSLDRRREHLLVQRSHARPSVRPDRVDASSQGRDPLVIAVLVAEVSATAGFVRRCRRHLNVWTETLATVGRTAIKDVCADPRRIVSGVVPADVDRTVGRVDRQPLVEMVCETRIDIDLDWRSPRLPAVGRPGDKNVRAAAQSSVHPRAVQRAPVRSGAGVRPAGRIEKRPPRVHRRDPDIEGNLRGCDHVAGTEAVAPVGRAALGEPAVLEVLPGDVQRSVGRDKWVGADVPLRTGRSRAGECLAGEGHAAIARMSDHNPGRARRLAVDVAGVIPGRIDRVAERAPQVGVDGDHWLVIELGGPRLGDEVRVHPGLPSVGRPAYRHGGAVDRTAAAEENHDPAVIDVAFRVPGDAGIGAEVEPVVGPRGRQRKIDAAPGLAAVAGKERPHGQAIDLIGASHDLARIARVYGDRGLALGTSFVAGVD